MEHAILTVRDKFCKQPNAICTHIDQKYVDEQSWNSQEIAHFLIHQQESHAIGIMLDGLCHGIHKGFCGSGLSACFQLLWTHELALQGFSPSKNHV